MIVLFKRFISYYKPYKKMFCLDMLASLIIAFVGMGYPILTNKILKDIVPSEELLKNEKIKFILIFGLVLLLCYIVRMFLTYFVQYYGHVMGVHMQADMRREMFTKLQRLPVSYYDEHETGKIMSRMTSDLWEISELAHHGPENLIICGISIVLSFSYLLFIEWRFALMLLCCVPLLIIINLVMSKKMNKAFAKTREAVAEINGSLESSIQGIKVTKAFTNSKHELDKFEVSNKRFVKERSKAYKSMGYFAASTKFVTDLFNIVLLVVGGILCVTDTKNFTISEYVTFAVSISIFITPLTTLINFTEQWQNGVTGFKRFTEIIDEKEEYEDIDAIEVQKLNGNIEFKNVSFNYETTKGVLKNVSFSIKKGENIALVGPSGGGKSTICHLIPAFYKPTSGNIFIDGYDISKLTFNSLRKNIGIVQQDVFLFSGSIMENVKYAKLDATDEEVYEACKKANIHDYIISLENGYNTEIGERGVKLSGGQKQRLSIARVFLKDPLILILDEATSALDNTTEALIQKSLEKLQEGRTTIVVAHRLSTIKNANKIYVISNGEVIESGSHKELLENKTSLYSMLYNQTYN